VIKKIAKRKKEKIFTIYLYCSLETCIKRNKKRKPHIPEKAVFIIHHEMEKPKRPEISINTDKIKLREAVFQILGKIKKFDIKF
jgi:adenylylsulfate kinase-like enzyme